MLAYMIASNLRRTAMTTSYDEATRLHAAINDLGSQLIVTETQLYAGGPGFAGALAATGFLVRLCSHKLGSHSGGRVVELLVLVRLD